MSEMEFEQGAITEELLTNRPDETTAQRHTSLCWRWLVRCDIPSSSLSRGDDNVDLAFDPLEYVFGPVVESRWCSHSDLYCVE